LYEPQPAHSTRLPKPPGYNLEWSRVTPIRDALVTGPPAKVSHHEHHLKLRKNLSSHTIIAPKPPRVHLTLLGEIWFQTAWRASHTARRQMPSRNSATPSPPSGPQACRQAQRTIKASVVPFPLAKPTLPPGASRVQVPLPLF